MSKILSLCVKAIRKYNMIENGDKVAVGISGGKDSLALLKVLSEYRKFQGVDFQLIGITIDQTGGKTDFSAVKDMCDELGVEYHLIKSDIFEIVFDVRKEKNPCSLCAKLRRGYLNSEAKKLGCNKVALAHHVDDYIETFFLSLLYEGRLNSFSPVTYLSNTDITAIRPLVFVEENDIVAYSKNLPIVTNICPANHKTKREEIKNLIKKLNKDFPNCKKQIKNALLNNEKIINNSTNA